jgi:hypothetical protein
MRDGLGVGEIATDQPSEVNTLIDIYIHIYR